MEFREQERKVSLPSKEVCEHTGQQFDAFRESLATSDPSLQVQSAAREALR